MTAIVFDYIIPIRRKAAARKSDPQMSHDAAKRAELGKAEMQRVWIKQTLMFHGDGLTVPELARVAPYPDWTGHALGKRISEVENISPTGERRDGSRVWSICNASAAADA
jgi:hypothetical protein